MKVKPLLENAKKAQALADAKLSGLSATTQEIMNSAQALEALDPAGLLQAVLSDDESSSDGGPADLQQEYEYHPLENDQDIIEDVFAAHAIGEELSKLSKGKVKIELLKKVASGKEATTLKAQKSTESPTSKDEKEKDEEEEKAVEPNLEWLWQLKDMGFPEKLSKEALVKVKNESIAAAVEAVVALQEAEKAILKELKVEKEEKKVTVVDWPCSQCTIINKPGLTICDMCGAAAPESAFVDAKAESAKKEEEEQKKKEEEEKLAREKQAEEERLKEEELRKIKEQEHKDKVASEFEKTKKFLE